MNYKAHYDKLISRARTRNLTEFYERHHVIPRCLGGSDEPQNLVKLTGAEHYVAHQLLVKLYPGNSKIAYAALVMSRTGMSPARLSSPNKLYAWLRKEHARCMSIKMRGNTYSKGMKLSEAHMEILRKPKSDEHKRKISAGNFGKTKGQPRGPQSEEHKRKIGEARARAWARARGELSS